MSSSVRSLFPRGGVMALALAIVLTVYLALQEQDIRQVAKGKGGGKPNIIVIMTDDQRFDLMDELPAVTKDLAKDGVTFTNAYTTTPLCCPSRSSFLTGEYAHNHGVWNNKSPNGSWKSFKKHEKQTLGVWLQKEGYKTALIGKYLNGYKNTTEVPPGWDDWEVVGKGRYFDYTMNENGKEVQYGHKDSDYSTDVLKDKAITFIKESKNKPYFLFLAVKTPHGDGDEDESDDDIISAPPPPAPRDKNKCKKLSKFDSLAFNEKDVSDKPMYIQEKKLLSGKDEGDIEKYRNGQNCSLIAVNDAIADILKTVGNKRNKTMIIFVSDNGYGWGEHRFIKKNCLYEGCAKAPMVISYPKYTKQGFTTDKIALNIDLTATILDVAGAKIPKSVNGVSLVPLLRDKNATPRNSSLIEVDSGKIGGQGKDYAIRMENYKYIELSNKEKELYDLKEDPYELQNLADDPKYADIQKFLAKQLHALIKDQKPSGKSVPAKNLAKKPKDKTPSPSETTSPSPSATESPEPSETQNPTDGTPTPQGRTITFSLTALLHGLGASGDSVNPAGKGNPSPTTTSKPFTVEVYSNDELVAESQGTVSYNKTKGNFTGNFTAHNIPPGTLQIIIKIPKYLSTEVTGQGVGKNTITLPVLTFVTGDVNNDDALDILDYNILTDCFDRAAHAKTCEKGMQQMSDLDENRTVDEPDINLFLRELKGRNEF